MVYHRFTASVQCGFRFNGVQQVEERGGWVGCVFQCLWHDCEWRFVGADDRLRRQIMHGGEKSNRSTTSQLLPPPSPTTLRLYQPVEPGNLAPVIASAAFTNNSIVLTCTISLAFLSRTSTLCSFVKNVGVWKRGLSGTGVLQEGT